MTGNHPWADYPTGDDPLLGALTGRLKILRNVPGPAASRRRDLLVLVPPSYETGTVRFPVVYMHDGQNLFDPATSHAGAWRVGRALDSIRSHGIEAIVVGVPNAGVDRIGEYSPFRDRRIGGGEGDTYVAWLADDVRRRVDAAFRTRTDPSVTCLAGSSMGGLISLYALFRRPDAFGVAGALSPALWFARRAIFRWLDGLETVAGRVYLDAGTAEGPLLLADVARFRDCLIDRGLRFGRDLHCVFERAGQHDEASWGRRLPAALRFMLDQAATGRGTP
ncbi:MAG TPA: alpha/beta hydrolase-fold protein [Longimicrobiales bacterium]|nr:alpha/beta hydrolase-fold protein [Longimicrobiales bacterium]